MSEIKFIKEINLKSLRDAILDNGIRETDAIFLHPSDFDDIACEHRDTYKESIAYPFFLLGVFIGTNEKMIVPPTEIRIERNIQIPQVQKIEEIEDYPPFDSVYRCGWCGNVVDYDGKLLTSEAREEHIRVLEKFKKEINEIAVNGDCCPLGYESKNNKLWL
mgnify:CR=1 FL=1|jgi:SepF-like predicted cell division protein (DUF552 family)